LDGSLLDQIFSYIAQPSLYDDTIDFLCELIKQIGHDSNNMRIIQLIYPKLAHLRPLLDPERDSDDLRGLTRLFIESGEVFLPLIEKEFGTFSDIVDAILLCTALDDLELVPMTFNFWFQLAYQVSNSNSPEFKLGCEKRFDSLVYIMLKHIHYPKDLDSWTAEERDDFRSFRHTMGDVLKDCCKVLGTSVTLGKSFSLLSSLLDRGMSASWQEIEAPLFSFRTMGSVVPDNENEIIPKVMELIPSLPEHPKIRYAATLVIGCYSVWTKLHPQYIPAQLTYISRGFDNQEVAAAAAMALKFLCRECSTVCIP
jgi:transportin-3